MNHIEAMELALEEARAAMEHGDVPVGAVMLDPEGNVVASAHNRKEENNDPTAHAELLAIQEAATKAGDWRLAGYTLVVTLEPCPMCAMAAVWARVETIIFGAADPKAGAAWSLFNIPQDKRLNHHIEMSQGILADECGELLEAFFSDQR
ncbi:MAG: nucleoside deaminase [Acidimicrobiia bacterium]|nr:nucleoside deaminase [Acidimicrobiia bacterium]